MLIQADIISFVVMLLTSLAAGIVGTWLLLRRRGRRRASMEDVDGKDATYLVFTGLSHHLKTAGEVIRGHLRGFTEELPSDAERWRVARRAIAAEASGIDNLINRLDLLVRLGMAGQPLVVEPVNITRVLEDIMVELGPAADAKGVLLGGIVSGSEEQLQHISCDALALRETFANLLENAVKHNGPGTEIGAEVRQQHNQITVRIFDNGKGIPEQTLNTIFERGSRSYRPGTAGGTGMGLYLCKLMVELHGGEIIAKSTEGEGTEFLITLPARRSR